MRCGIVNPDRNAKLTSHIAHPTSLDQDFRFKLSIFYRLKWNSFIQKLGHVADKYGKNETAKEPGESDLKPEQGNFKGNYPVQADQGPGRKIGDQRSNIRSCLE
jgi:hypothetical protein